MDVVYSLDGLELNSLGFEDGVNDKALKINIRGHHKDVTITLIQKDPDCPDRLFGCVNIPIEYFRRDTLKEATFWMGMRAKTNYTFVGHLGEDDTADTRIYLKYEIIDDEPVASKSYRSKSSKRTVPSFKTGGSKKNGKS